MCPKGSQPQSKTHHPEATPKAGTLQRPKVGIDNVPKEGRSRVVACRSDGHAGCCVK